MKQKKMISFIVVFAVSCMIMLTLFNPDIFTADAASSTAGASPNTASDTTEEFFEGTSADQMNAPSIIQQGSSLSEEIAYLSHYSLGVKEVKTNSLTPQDFNAKGDGVADDTEAFRKLFSAAFSKSENTGSWRPCVSIYIPSGTYKITGSIIDQDLKLHYGMFEVNGAGKDKTKIVFSGDVMFDTIENTVENRVFFGFTTFRDISFEGKNNVFMTLNDNKLHSDGTQRMQFISCSFSNFNSILYSYKSTVMLSEFTLSHCKITSCGTEQKPCKMFYFNNSQAVNWRLLYTDIEKTIGDVFYYERGSSVSLVSCSVEVTKGNVFNFDFNKDTTGSSGPSNAPQAICNDCTFSVKDGSTFVRSVSPQKANVITSFNNCNLNTDKYFSKNFLDITGGYRSAFNDCQGCSNIIVKGDFTGNADFFSRISFRNCPDLNLDNMVEYSSFRKQYTDGQGKTVPVLGRNNLHITVDDTYDFYLKNQDYHHIVCELHECKQPVKLGNSEKVTISNNKSFSTKPYGYVKYVQIRIPDNSANANKIVNFTLYNNGSKVGDTIKITLGTEKVYTIQINDYSDELKGEFTHTLSSSPTENIELEIIKL